MSGVSAIPGVVHVDISWDPPMEPNGVIVNYEVGFTISTGVLNYINTSATQRTLRYLSPNTMITFSVRAYTIIGPGENVLGNISTEDIRELT